MQKTLTSTSQAMNRKEIDQPRSTHEQEGESEAYLNSFDEQSPIAVLVTPLRKRQGQILARNLSQAGAHVIDAESTETMSTSKLADLVVVTDAKSKAEARLKGCTVLFRRVRYVSTKWASKVLSACTPLPLEGYILDGGDVPQQRGMPGSNLDETFQPSKKQRYMAPPQRLFLPVWYTGPLSPSSTSDISEKEAFLGALPPYLCERSTLCQSLYPSPNKALCDVLERLAEKRGLEQAGGTVHMADIRSRAYRLASAALKCVPFRLQNGLDARALRSFGPRVLEVVSEFLRTGRVKEADMLDQDDRLRTMRDFCRVYGIGFQTARLLYDVRGMRDLTALKKRVGSCPEEFSAPLVQYMGFLEVMGKADLGIARRYCSRVQEVVNGGEYGGVGIRMVLCGGFRRGERGGHDVDLLYCRRSGQAKDTSSVLRAVEGCMRKHGLLVATLHLADDKKGWEEQRYNKDSGDGARSKYRFAHDMLHGLGCFEGQTFRVDVVGVRDVMEFAFATLAWSGSTAFQRDLREMCHKRHDWTFNAHGLFRRADGGRVEASTKAATEVDVFAVMVLVYRPPFERCC